MIRWIWIVLLVSFSSLSAQVRTVLVSPTPGNAAASGTTLRNALAGISSPSSSNRWLVKIEPGLYDIGTTPLPMRSWVDVEGSGIGATVISGTVDGSSLTSGTLHGASNAELRLLTVTATATSTVPYVIAMYNENVTALRIYRVRFTTTAAGTGSVWGIRNGTSAPAIEESEISVSGISTTAAAYGVVYLQTVSGARASISRSRIAVSGAAANYGIAMIEGQTLTDLRDSRIDVTGGQNTYGIHATGPGWSGSDVLTIRDTDVSSAGGSVSSTGVHLTSATSVGLDVANTRILGHVSPSAYGVRQLGTTPMSFQSAAIVGATKTVESGGSVSIASTHLNGGAVTAAGWTGCMGVWDENGVFYANSCP